MRIGPDNIDVIYVLIGAILGNTDLEEKIKIGKVL
jgi:hypothetical protein